MASLPIKGKHLLTVCQFYNAFYGKNCNFGGKGGPWFESIQHYSQALS